MMTNDDKSRLIADSLERALNDGGDRFTLGREQIKEIIEVLQAVPSDIPSWTPGLRNNKDSLRADYCPTPVPPHTNNPPLN